jgi:uncharacterized membrane protein
MRVETIRSKVYEVATMHEWFVTITDGAVLVIDIMVLVIIATGTIQAFVQGLQVMLLPSATGHERRNVWLHYARWLVAGLTFQLAADILATSIAPSWDELVRLAIVAAIRTLLNFFLERDLSEIRGRQSEPIDSKPVSG